MSASYTGSLLAGGHRYEEGMPYRGEGVAVEAHREGRLGGGAPGPYKEGYEKIMGVGASRVSLSLLECFGTFLKVSGASRKCFGSFWSVSVVSGMLRYFASLVSTMVASGMFL